MTEEIFPGIYTFDLEDSRNPSTSRIHIYVIKGAAGERSLMIDAGYKDPVSVRRAREALESLGIPVSALDIFLTHKHPDHTGLCSYYAGLGARIFLNPEEDVRAYDCLYYNDTAEALREQRIVHAQIGITDNLQPLLMERMQKLNEEIHRPGADTLFNEKRDYPLQPIRDGQEFACGAYHFRAIALPGHTIGHMGLCEEAHKLFFPGDHLLGGMISTVSTSYMDVHMLRRYLTSLQLLEKDYEDYTYLPAHGDRFTELLPVLLRSREHYDKKCEQLLGIMTEIDVPITVTQAAFLLYRMPEEEGPEDITQLKLILTKTFSLMEYLYDSGRCRRILREGTLYYALPGKAGTES